MPRVTTKEKNQAKAQARETARFLRKSSEAATNLGARMMSQSLVAYRRGDAAKINGIVADEFRKITPIMTEIMTVAYLTGLDRMRAARNDATIAADLHGQALRMLYKRLQIDPSRLDELRRAEEAQAVRMLTRVQDGVEKKLQRAMTRITQDGLTVTEGTIELRKAFAAAGVVPVNSFEIEAVFRTQTNLAYGAGAYAAAQDPVIDEILWGYKYVTVGDDRVRPEHAALEGTTAPKDDPIWQSIWPPNGWACRCQVIFIFEERETVKPDPVVEIDDKLVVSGPDAGFNFNPGILLRPGATTIRMPQAIGQKPIGKVLPTPGQKLTDDEERVVEALQNKGRKSDKKIREELGMTQEEILDLSNTARIKLEMDVGEKFKKKPKSKKPVKDDND